MTADLAALTIADLAAALVEGAIARDGFGDLVEGVVARDGFDGDLDALRRIVKRAGTIAAHAQIDEEYGEPSADFAGALARLDRLRAVYERVAALAAVISHAHEARLDAVAGESTEAHARAAIWTARASVVREMANAEGPTVDVYRRALAAIDAEAARAR